MADNQASRPWSGDELFAAVVIAVGVLTFVVWSGAQLGTVVSAGEFLAASPADAFSAAIRLPSAGSDPSLAWPVEVRSSIAGPVLYWVSTAVALGVEVPAVVWVWLKVTGMRVGTRDRDRLGVQIGARLASRKELDPLVVRGPTPGRFIFGRDRGRLLATESGDPTPTDRRFTRTRRPGRRSAVAAIGPSQSGKTSTVVAGILDWDGPAILSSVKNDLFDATVARRLQLGDVFVFDPMRTIPNLPDEVVRVGWSPLRNAKTVPGAIEIALAMLDAAPKEGVTNANYWTSKGQALLWPMLFAAAHDDEATMADVVRWLSSQDGKSPSNNNDEDDGDESNGEGAADTKRPFSRVRAILEDRGIGDGPVAIQARHALAQFEGFFELDRRTRSDIYSTSQTLVQPWEDPNVSFASSAAAGAVADLEMVLSGNNTLYLAVPLKDASRYSVVFGGLLGTLLRDQAYDVANRSGGRLPGLLCVIDEAGNTPLRWLPEVASTCSGVGVQLVTVWQSKAQIDAIYQTQAGPLLTNHATKVFFAGASDSETLRYVSALGGDEEVAQRSAQADAHLGGHRRGVGDSTTHRPLLPPEVLRQAEPGNAVLFHGSIPPAHIQGRHVANDARLRALSEGSAPDPGKGEASNELMKALSFDPTPPLAVLKHLDAATIRANTADEEKTDGSK